MKFEELGLQIGDTLQLQLLSDENKRYPIKVIGYVPNKSFITTAAYSEPGRPANFQEKQPVIIRFAVHSGVTGFKTKILTTRTIPYPYIHFAMPDDVKMLEVRKAHRVTTNVLATIDNLDDKSFKTGQGQIVDLSLVGAGINCLKAMGESGQNISITFDAQIGEISKILVLQGVIRSITEPDDLTTDKKIFSYGIQLQNVDEEDLMALHAFVYQKLLQQMHVL